MSLENMDPTQECYDYEYEYQEETGKDADHCKFPADNMLAVTSLFSLYGCCFMVIHARLT